MTWRAMFTAPKDGSIILAVSEDFTSLEAIYWGYHQIYEPKEGWFLANDEDGMLSHNETMWAGWLPCETVPQWEENIKLATAEYHKTYGAKDVQS